MSRDGFEVHLWRLQVLVLHPNSLEGEIGAENGAPGKEEAPRWLWEQILSCLSPLPSPASDK
ncbi:hypothetical protein RLOC_00000132 [Lonchura striata]|uniref:Uncharacterized protein n=1 Tax=Lonchura striata TaxID=40157 RepID=A0A218UF32_9PASE|nr:hypothetical protein RLOC_00000132 [Lonchura striata domestica]